MEQETIIYYYPMTEQMAREENRYAAKKHWFQETSLKTVLIASQEEFQVLGCAVPPFYYRHKPWKAQVLSEVMETVLGDAAGMTDTWLHPEIKALLTAEYCSKWTPRESTIRMLVRHLLAEYAGETFARCDRVTVLLGYSADTNRQMETTWELLQPFLPRINRMLIYYEKRIISRREEWQQDKKEREEQEEREEQDIQDELKEYLGDYYYEYGLVPQLEPYVKPRTAGAEAVPALQLEGAESAQLKCGKAKCGGAILDYCDQFRYPKILPEGGVYIDTVSVMDKERQLRRKDLSVPYLSPLKYLDTMVKNSYDRLVIKGEGIL